MRKTLFWWFLFFILFVGTVNAANIYIDFNWSGTESGTFAEPYNSFEDVDTNTGNGAGRIDLNPANDYYIKEGSTVTRYDSWELMTDGNSTSDRIVIGVYNASTGAIYNRTDSYTKPIITNNAITSGKPTDDCFDVRASYYDIWGLELRNFRFGVQLGNESGDIVETDEAYARISYMDIKGTGATPIAQCVRSSTYALGGKYYDYVEVDHIRCDTNSQIDEDFGYDAIGIARKSRYGYVHHNYVNGADHMGITLEGAEGIAEYNYVTDDYSVMDACFNFAQNTNETGTSIFRYNMCEGLEPHVDKPDEIRTCISIGGHSPVEFYGNVCKDVMNTGSLTPYYGIIQVTAKNWLYDGSTIPIGQTNTKVYNNTIINGSSTSPAFKISNTIGAGYINGIEIKNNIAIGVGGTALPRSSMLYLSDTGGYIADSNWSFQNNLYCFADGNCTGNNYADIDGSYYASADAFNTGEASASGNLEADPNLATNLVPQVDSAAIDAGLSLAAAYDDAIDGANTVWTGTYPAVALLDQDLYGSGWEIGAYVYSTATAFFTDGFESGDLTHVENGANWFGGVNTSVSTDTARTGTYSLKFTHGPTNGSHGEQRFDLGAAKDEVWIAYYLKFPSNYDPGTESPSNNKFLRLWSDNAEYSGDPGKVGASLWRSGSYSVLEPDANKSYSGGWVFDCNGSIGSVANIDGMGKWTMDAGDLNRWVYFKWRFKRDSGTGNGAMGLWIDGAQIYHKENISYGNSPCPEYYLTGYLMGADNSDPATTQYFYIDDFVLSDTDPDGGGTDTTPPVISNPLPSGEQACTSDPRDITLQITTNENATCKWNGQDATYENMNWTFNNTSGTSHSHTLSGMNCGGTWVYYARCQDGSGNKNTTSTQISFSIAESVSSFPTLRSVGGGGSGALQGGGTGAAIGQ